MIELIFDTDSQKSAEVLLRDQLTEFITRIEDVVIVVQSCDVSVDCAKGNSRENLVLLADLSLVLEQTNKCPSLVRAEVSGIGKCHSVTFSGPSRWIKRLLLLLRVLVRPLLQLRVDEVLDYLFA